MYEVELKLPAALEPVRNRLAELGADRRGIVRQVDTYYDAPDRSFAETDEALRLRRERRDGTEIQLTYKGPLVDDDSKSRREAETVVEDAEALAAILEGLGFEPAATVRKERERFELDGYAVTLDTVEGVGEFVEIETTATAAELDDAREGAFEIVDRLGLDAGDCTRRSYLEMVLEGRSP